MYFAAFRYIKSLDPTIRVSLRAFNLQIIMARKNNYL